MRAVVVMLLLGGAGGALLYYSNRVLYHRKNRPKPLNAYFSGGPFDGQNRKQDDLPQTLTSGDHIYRREHFSGYDAIYVYLGEVDSPDVLSKELM